MQIGFDLQKMLILLPFYSFCQEQRRLLSFQAQNGMPLKILGFESWTFHIYLDGKGKFGEEKGTQKIEKCL